MLREVFSLPDEDLAQQVGIDGGIYLTQLRYAATFFTVYVPRRPCPPFHRLTICRDFRDIVMPSTHAPASKTRPHD